MTAREYRVSLGVLKRSETDWGGNWLYSSMNILKAFELYTFKWVKCMLGE